MRQIFVPLAGILALFLSSGIALAQSAQTTTSVPRLVNVTGVYQPADGQPPPAGTVVTLLIYADQQGGTPLWQETQNVALDKSGRFSLMLGAGQPDGIPLEVFASGEAQWLALHFAGVGEVEGARARITSVPYALRSADADTLGGHPASAYLLAPSTTTGKGTTTTAAGQASATGTDPGTPTAQDVVLPGTVNVLAKYVTAADVGPSAVSEVSGRVGINTGTALPADYLHIKFTDQFGAFTGLAVQNLSNNANAASGMLFYDQNGALAQFQGFSNTSHEYRINNIASGASINFLTGSTSRFLVAPSGNIGIGTATPSALLEVSNAIPGGPANVWTTSFTNLVGPYYLGRRSRGTSAAPTAAQTGDGLSGLYGQGYGTTQFGPGNSGITVQAAQNFTDTAQGTALTFSTTPINSVTPSTRMTLDAFGFLGIGTITTPPAGMLEVSNAAVANALGSIVSSNFSNTSAPLFIGRRARGTGVAPSAVLAGDPLVGYLAQGHTGAGFSGTRGGMFVTAAENWNGTAQGTSLNFNTTLNGTTTPGTKMTIDNAGNVGVGTFFPDAPLEVNRTGTDAAFEATVYTNGSGNANPLYFTRYANGTSAAPTATQTGNIIGAWIASGYGTTGFGDVSGGMGVIAEENFTDAAHGAATGFLSTPIGSNVPQLHMAVLPSGFVGIGDWTIPGGTPTAADRLQVFGDIRVGDSGTNGCLKNFAGTQLTGTCVSDRRFKKNITPFGSALSQLTALQPVHFYWRAAEFPDRHFGEAQAYGLIAQDVEQVLPELVVTGKDGFKQVDYAKLPLLTIQAVKELKERVAELERLIQEMRAMTPGR